MKTDKRVAGLAKTEHIVLCLIPWSWLSWYWWLQWPWWSWWSWWHWHDSTVEDIVDIGGIVKVEKYWGMTKLEEDENISRIIWPFFFSSAVCHKPGFAPASLGPVRRKIHNLCTWLYFGYCPVVNPLEIARNSISLFSVTKSTSLNNYTRGIFAKPGALKGAEFHVYFLYLNKH